MPDEDQLEARIDDLEARVGDLEQLVHDGAAGDDVTGMREFVDQTDPDSHPERALAIAYYLDQYQGYENFTRTDIEDGYRTCRTQKPANLSDTLAALEDKGWAMDDGKDGKSRLRRLTGDGLDVIEEEIDNGA